MTAGTYGSSTNSARITVDAKGIVTSVVEQAIPQGDVTSVVAGTGLTGGGSAGDVTLSVAQTGVVAKTYGNATNYQVFTRKKFFLDIKNLETLPIKLLAKDLSRPLFLLKIQLNLELD